MDGNISMEEDTELRDLVVQTLENNGVLAKVRNAEPLLNKTVKQYLESSEGKLLFSLVREFLEYFELDYTISVYDPETHFGKEYNYVGRNKLCEELGISSTKPLLGEILKNHISSVLITPQKNTVCDKRLDETKKGLNYLNNATFEVNHPKVFHKGSTAEWYDTDISENEESYLQSNSQIPFNVKITDNNQSEQTLSTLKHSSSCISNICNAESTSIAKHVSAYDEVNKNDCSELNLMQKTLNTDEKTEAPFEVSIEYNRNNLEQPNVTSLTEACNTNFISTKDENQIIPIENISKTNSVIIVEKNVQNTNKIVSEPFEKSIYFGEIIVEGKAEKVETLINQTDSILRELPPLISRSNPIFSDLPPLSCKKTSLNDLKELMQIATDGVDNYDQDFISSPSCSASEQSPSNDESSSLLKSQVKKEENVYSEKPIHSEGISEEIEDIISS
ncbi:uncharacterized protein LOC117177707 isoform X2 [Belonocnema kinseyi]|uniref:uncharacterized protein LOC117177707 isoform X2 n=1 Tax=Belonocnema kinseyi TaxID=2817044 RepID=UPI00143DA292|nr:uncharacterized protein LOC117177707 isoform X2 [Belonocnema kinseyi]